MAAASELGDVIVTRQIVHHPMNDDLQAGVEALTAITTNLDASWKRVLLALEKEGVPGVIFDTIAALMRETILSGRQTLSLLDRFTDAYAEHLAAAREILDRVDLQAKGFQGMDREPPTVDPERLQHGAQEMERGEGMDGEAFLAAFLKNEGA